MRKEVENAICGDAVARLQVGDIVWSRGEETTVVGVRTDTEDPCVLCSDSDVWMAEVQPVEITPELLEANGFKVSEDGTYCMLRTLFHPFGEDGVPEFEDFVVVDFAVPSASLVKHQYLCGGDVLAKPFLEHRIFEGGFTYVHELQEAMRSCWCATTIHPITKQQTD